MTVQTDAFGLVSDDSSACDSQTAFLVTKLNSRYLADAKRRGARSVITPLQLVRAWEIDSRIRIIGITGTNGKTTTAAAIYSLLLDLGYKVGLQGTRGVYINDAKVEGKTLTTPPILHTLVHIKEAIAQGCDFYVMEVSSHAIDQERIEGLPFALKIFTNLTQDHLDYHQTMAEYARVKSRFFEDETPKLVNKDQGGIISNPAHCYTYGIENPASFGIKAYLLKEGISAVVQYFDEVADFESPLFGLFNLYNLCAAISAVKLVTEKPLAAICEAVAQFGGVSGRMETLSQKPTIIVDFAHTPDGMQKVLETLKSPHLIALFGAGGNRDKTRRPLMGAVADRYAKSIFLTTDNPRDEEAAQIVDDIMEGIKNHSKVKVILDRAEAIRTAIAQMGENDILLLLGKGDEETIESKGVFYPYSDKEVVEGILSQKV